MGYSVLKSTISARSFVSLTSFSTDMESDLNHLCFSLRSIANKWELIGLQLHLSKEVLNVLADDNEGRGPSIVLSIVLQTWLRGEYETAMFGKPTWRMLVSALEEVEDFKHVAKEILEQQPWKS